jgi:sphingolipid delta-4 desaturase
VFKECFCKGEHDLDTDIPTELEAKLFTSPWRKVIWLTLQPLFYAFRPLLTYRKAPTDLELLNGVIQVHRIFYFFKKF